MLIFINFKKIYNEKKVILFPRQHSNTTTLQIELIVENYVPLLVPFVLRINFLVDFFNS